MRQRTYLVDDVMPPETPGQSGRVRLSCLDDDAQGEPLEVLWDAEIDAEVIDDEAWAVVASRGFDPAARFAAYLHTLRWNCVTATDPRLFQSPLRAGIRLDAYQLEPLRKALLLPRVNLFIADDVGLGKTIEAGLIARELLLRKKARDIVVCCPPSMLLQWRDELEARFGLTFQLVDKDYLTRVRQERGFAVNPWSTHSRFLISHRLLIDEGYTNPMLDWLGDFRPGSLLILDEAHHAAPASGQKYAIDSQTTYAVREMAKRFEHRLFLSATPHNGHSNSFSALLEILDPQRFCRGVPVRKGSLEQIMVRRLKEDLREVAGGFPRRHVVQVDIDGLPADAPELVLSRLLDEYRTLREERLSGQSKRQQAAAGLLITGLQQRLLSSVEAFARTLKVHRRTVLRQHDEAAKDLALPAVATSQLELLLGGVGSDDDRATLSELDATTDDDALVEAASLATLAPVGDVAFAAEQRLLDAMTEVAEAARGRADGRIVKLIRWMADHQCPAVATPHDARKGPPAPWTGTRVIIFTEYDDTKRYLYQQLSAVIEGTDRAANRIAIFHGPTPADERERIKRAFNADPAVHPVRILIATDAAREGLNLQAHCWNLFHFDVPWNPSRLEQRNGRIDRKLQPNPDVYCHYFFYQQRPEDRVLQTLVRKTATIRKELGTLNAVLDTRLATALRGGLRHRDLDTVQAEIDSTGLAADQQQAITDELESTRERQAELLTQIDKLRELLEASKKVVGFDEAQFRAAISTGLELTGASPLRPAEGADVGPARYVFPALDQREGGDPTWADTMDALRSPRPKDQSLWEWRRSSPPRPVVFQDPGVVTDEVVQLHLEHRVIQRLLSRFAAQGFVHHDLSRACLAHSGDAVPRVVLLGRLSLYGPGAARLHEELVPVTARWVDPKIRKAELSPYARDAETKTMALLETSLSNVGHDRPVDPVMQQQLRDAAAQDVRELLPHLETRAAEYAEDARKKLATRSDAEAKAMRTILEDQRKHIASEAAKHDRPDDPMLFNIPQDERRQLDDNRRHWSARLKGIEAELETEPARIRDLYTVKASRVEPVGLVYLWPVTG